MSAVVNLMADDKFGNCAVTTFASARALLAGEQLSCDNAMKTAPVTAKAETFSPVVVGRGGGSVVSGRASDCVELSPDDSASNRSVSEGPQLEYVRACRDLRNLGFSHDQVVALVTRCHGQPGSSDCDSVVSGESRSSVRRREFRARGEALADEPGYCYLRLVRCSKRSAVREALGPSPTLSDLMRLDAGLLAFGDWYKLKLLDVSPGVCHVAWEGGTSRTFAQAVGATALSFGRVVPASWQVVCSPVGPPVPVTTRLGGVTEGDQGLTGSPGGPSGGFPERDEDRVLSLCGKAASVRQLSGSVVSGEVGEVEFPLSGLPVSELGSSVWRFPVPSVLVLRPGVTLSVNGTVCGGFGLDVLEIVGAFRLQLVAGDGVLWGYRATAVMRACVRCHLRAEERVAESVGSCAVSSFTASTAVSGGGGVGGFSAFCAAARRLRLAQPPSSASADLRRFFQSLDWFPCVPAGVEAAPWSWEACLGADFRTAVARVRVVPWPEYVRRYDASALHVCLTPEHVDLVRSECGWSALLASEVVRNTAFVVLLVPQHLASVLPSAVVRRLLQSARVSFTLVAYSGGCDAMAATVVQAGLLDAYVDGEVNRYGLVAASRHTGNLRYVRLGV